MLKIISLNIDSLGFFLKDYLTFLIDYYEKELSTKSVPIEKTKIISKKIIDIEKMANKMKRCDNISFKSLLEEFDKFDDKQEITFLSLRRGFSPDFIKQELNKSTMYDDRVIESWISMCCLEKDVSTRQGNIYEIVALRNDLDEEAIKIADSLIPGAYKKFVRTFGQVENYLYNRGNVQGKDRLNIEIDVFDVLANFYPADNSLNEVPFVSWNHFHTTGIKDGLEIPERYKSTAYFFSISDINIISGDVPKYAFLRIGLKQKQSEEIRELLRQNGTLDNNYRVNPSINFFDDKIDLNLGEEYSKYKEDVIEILIGFKNPLRMDAEVFSSLGIGFIDNSYSYIDVNGELTQLHVTEPYKEYVNRLLVFRDVYSYITKNSTLKELGKIVEVSLLIRNFWTENISKDVIVERLKEIGLEQELVEKFKNEEFEGSEKWKTFFGIQGYYPELDALERGHLSYFVSRSIINRMIERTELGKMSYYEAIEFIKLKSTKLLRMMLCEKYDLSDLFIRNRKFFGNGIVSEAAKTKYIPLFKELWDATNLTDARIARDNILKAFDELYQKGELYDNSL